MDAKDELVDLFAKVRKNPAAYDTNLLIVELWAAFEPRLLSPAQKQQLDQHSVRIDGVEAGLKKVLAAPRWSSSGLVAENGFYFLNKLVLVNLGDDLTPIAVRNHLEEILSTDKSFVRIDLVSFQQQRNGKKKATIGFPPAARPHIFRAASTIRAKLGCAIVDALTPEGIQERIDRDHDFRECKDNNLYPTWREGAVLHIRPEGLGSKPEPYVRQSYGSPGGSGEGSVNGDDEPAQSTSAREQPASAPEQPTSSAGHTPFRQPPPPPSPSQLRTPPPPPPPRNEDRGREAPTPSESAFKQVEKRQKNKYGVQSPIMHAAGKGSGGSDRDPRLSYAAALQHPASPKPSASQAGGGSPRHGPGGQAGGHGHVGGYGAGGSGGGVSAAAAGGGGGEAAAAAAGGGTNAGGAQAAEPGASPKSPPRG